MKKAAWLLVIATTIASLTGYGDIIVWGTVGQQIFGQDNTTYLPGNTDRDETTTGFTQLLWLGPNGVYDGIVAAGDGTLGDDVVIAQSWMGEGNPDFMPAIPGQFTASDRPDNDIYTSGVDSFAIRIFDTAVSDVDWAAGNIPLAGYYNYVVFESPTKLAATDRYELLIDFNLATIYDIPEPSAFLLLGLGLAWFGFGRRPRTA